MSDFRILAGLPPYGDMARAVPESFGQSGREGLVVEFLPGTSQAWIANFRPAELDKYQGVLHHPNGRDLVVFASGAGYVVDPGTRALKPELGEFGLEMAWRKGVS